MIHRDGHPELRTQRREERPQSRRDAAMFRSCREHGVGREWARIGQNRLCILSGEIANFDPREMPCS